MLLLAGPLKKRIAQTFRLGSLWILSHKTFDQTFMTKGISVARKFHCQNRSFWDLEFSNGNGCKSLIAEEKGQQYQEMLCMRLFSRTTFPGVIGSSVDYLGNTAQCQLTRTRKRIEITKIIVPVQMSLIQVRLWVKFLLESPAILTCQVTTNRRFWKVSYFKQNLFNFRRFLWSTNLITPSNS